MTTAKTSLLMLSLISALGACSTEPVAPPPVQTVSAAPKPMTTPAPAPSPPSATTARTAPTSAVATVTLPPYLDPKSDIYSGRSVYFDFDEAQLKSEFGTLVEHQGKYLASNPRLVVRLEGNTDERGSAEYNLALGQKRAEALRQALKIYGVKDDQVEAVSWGKEKPKATQHDESAWAQNRRADVVYPSK